VTFLSHMTSSITWPFNSPYAIFYRCPIGTEPLFSTVFLDIYIQIHDYADDIGWLAIIETSQMGMQLMTEEVEKLSRRVWLRMNVGKCKIMVSNNSKDSRVITAEEKNVEVVEDFCYLRSYLSRTGNCDRECDTLHGWF